MRRNPWVLTVTVLLVLPQVVWAQSNVSTGMLLGTTADPDGARLPGVTVEASNVDTGFRRHALADASGSFRIDLLPSGTYDLRAALPGFTTEVRRGIRVTLGSRVKIDLQLQLAPVEKEIVVTAEAPVVETTNPGVTASVSDTAIATLPLYGRDFGDLVLLTPASVAGRSAPGDEYEIPTSHGGVSIGARSIQNSFNIDGSTAQSSFFGNERGDPRVPFTFSQAAIKELQVLQSSYDLQFSASGAVINAITKSGTNELHGEVFAYYLNDSFVQSNAFGEEIDDFEQLQYGLAIGGPITRDRLHYFASFDGQDLEEPDFRQFASFPTGREAEWEALTGLDWETETGPLVRTDGAMVLMVKLDWQLSISKLLTLRDNWLDYEGENRLNNNRSAGWSNNGALDNSYNSFVANLNWVVSNDSINELIVQHSVEKRPRDPYATSPPATNVVNGGYFGQYTGAPSWMDEERLQLIDNFTHSLGAHTIRAGANIDLVDFDNNFLQYGGGWYRFWGWDDFFQGIPDRYIQAFSDSGGQVIYSADSYAVYLQDEWRPRPDLTINYGLRFDYQDHDQPRTANPLFPLTGQIPSDRDNWAPRVGFAWDLGGDGTQVLRGGVGFFYDTTPTVLGATAMLRNGVDVVQVTLNCFSVDCPTYPERWQSVGEVPMAVSDIYVFDPQFEQPQTLHASLGYERQLLADLSVAFDLIYSQGHHLERKQDRNLSPTGELTVVGTPIYEQYTLYPELGQITMFTSDARNHYRALVLKARKRYSKGWFLDASYTWSESRDQDSNERSVGRSVHFAEDQYNLDGEWGPSDFDVEHKLVVAASVELPWDFMVSGIVMLRSGFPYTAWHWLDPNGDGNTTDRAIVEVEPGVFYHYPRNSFRQPWYYNLDLRLSKIFNLGASSELELIAEVFNLLDSDNLWVGNFNQILSRGCYYEDDVWQECRTLDTFGERDNPGEPRKFQLGMKLRF